MDIDDLKNTLSRVSGEPDMIWLGKRSMEIMENTLHPSPSGCIQGRCDKEIIIDTIDRHKLYDLSCLSIYEHQDYVEISAFSLGGRLTYKGNIPKNELRRNVLDELRRFFKFVRDLAFLSAIGIDISSGDTDFFGIKEFSVNYSGAITGLVGQEYDQSTRFSNRYKDLVDLATDNCSITKEEALEFLRKKYGEQYAKALEGYSLSVIISSYISKKDIEKLKGEKYVEMVF